MNILKLIAELGLDASGFNRGMDNARSKSAKAGEEIGSAFKSTFVRFLGAAAVVGYVRSISQEIDHLKDSSERLGVTTDEFQRMQIAAKRAGLELEGNKGIGKVFNELAGLRAQAEGGDVKAILQLNNLGVSMLGAADSSETLYDAFMKVINLTDQKLADTFGGKVLLDIKAFREELGKIGQVNVFSEEQIVAIKNANLQLENVARNLKIAGAEYLNDYIIGGFKRGGILGKGGVAHTMLAAFFGKNDIGMDQQSLEPALPEATRLRNEIRTGQRGGMSDKAKQEIIGFQRQRQALEDELNKLVLPTLHRTGGFNFGDFIASSSGRGVGAAIGATAAIRSVAPPLNPELKTKIDEITRLIKEIAQKEQDTITFRQ